METISGPRAPLSGAAKADLSKPLDATQIKKRKGAGGRELSYVAGHYAIGRANDIFGYDGWDQRVDDRTLLCEYQAKDGRGNEKWFVSYNATVTVTAGGVSRQDVGTGHGQEADRGQAHESAIKEAVTDALKRALKTFGDQFGLCLYDKDYDPNKVEDSGPGTVEPTLDQIAAMKALIKSAFKDRADYDGFVTLAGGNEQANTILFIAVKEGKTSRDQINQLLMESKVGQ